MPAIVDYDNFSVPPDVDDAYSTMVKELAERHYSRVTRYTTSAFLRAEARRCAAASGGVAPHIFESARDARRYLDALAKPAG